MYSFSYGWSENTKMKTYKYHNSENLKLENDTSTNKTSDNRKLKHREKQTHAFKNSKMKKFKKHKWKIKLDYT